jgi:hypothetical protein
MTTPRPTQLELPPVIRRALASLRARVRRYVVIESLALMVVWLGVAFWATLAIDWFFEPPAIVRMMLLAAAGFTLLGIIARKLVERLAVTLTDANMATLLERRFPELGDALLTAVTLADDPPDPAECSPVMLAATRDRAAAAIDQVHPARVFDPRPLRLKLLAAVLLMVSVAMYVAVEPRGFAVWAQRCLAFSDEPWPRFTRLLVEGFDEDGTA